MPMDRVGDILGTTLRRMGDPNVAEVWLAATWKSLVGEAMASHSRPLSAKKGMLRVAVDGSLWRNQMKAMENEIRERVNLSWGRAIVQEIRFEVARPAVPYAVDNEHTPFVRSRIRETS
jgi:predicted nucleic acid-binding Zn ribbon protein